jgi:integrase
MPCIVLAIETGMRRSKLARLEWPQVNFAKNVIRLQAGPTKNNQARSVPLSCVFTGRLRMSA